MQFDIFLSLLLNVTLLMTFKGWNILLQQKVQRYDCVYGFVD
jgi:hypothetical protein